MVNKSVKIKQIHNIISESPTSSDAQREQRDPALVNLMKSIQVMAPAIPAEKALDGSLEGVKEGTVGDETTPFQGDTTQSGD